MSNNFHLKLTAFIIALFSPLCIDLYIAAVPAIEKEFNMSGSFTLSVFLFSMGVGQFYMGKLYDAFGPEKVVIYSLIGLIISSFSVYFCKDYNVFISIRIIQGLFVSGLSLTALAMIKDNFNEKDAASMYGYLSSIMNVVPSVAPFVGASIVLRTGDWRGIFILISFLGLISIPYIMFHLKKSKRKHKGEKSEGWIFFKNKNYKTYSPIAISSLATLFFYVMLAPNIIMIKMGWSSLEFSTFFALNGLTMLISGFVFGKMVSKKEIYTLFIYGIYISVLAFISSVFSMFYIIMIIPTFLLYSIAFVFLIASSTSLSLSTLKSDTGKAISFISASQMIFGALLGLFIVYIPSNTEVVFSISILLPLLYSLILIINHNGKKYFKSTTEINNSL